MNRAARILAACALTGALAGCVAVAIPVVAMGAITKKQIDGPRTDKPRKGQAIFPAELATLPPASPPPSPLAASARTPVFAGERGMRASLVPGQPAGVAPGPVPAAIQPAALVVSAPASVPAEGPRATLVPLTALPPPSAAPPVLATTAPVASSAALLPPQRPRASLSPGPVAAIDTGNGYLGLVSYAISRAGAPDATSVGMAIDPGAPLGVPRRGQCGALPPAVLIDLDPGVSPFDPSRSDAQGGLAEALGAMRASGITVLWASALQVGQAETVRDALQRSGLDPARTDRLLLLNGPGDRKQARRATAVRNWCVVAMAGDRRGDFDESYDYLRNPEASIPADALFGAGWFIAPPPLP